MQEHSLTVRRWRRYGTDRAFVVGASGSPLGSVDLASGQVDLVAPGSEDAVRRAVQEYLRRDLDELVVPQQRPPADGLTVDDEELLASWLGSPVLAGTPVPSRREVAVRSRLDRLGDLGWTVLHDVPIGVQGSTCAHLLIGPSGVFAVRRVGRAGSRVVVHGATLTVDGEPSTVVRDAGLEARRVRALLLSGGASRVVVRPVVAVSGELEVVRPSRVAGPLLATVADLVGMLRALPDELSLGEQAALARVARRATTWLV